jgi:hypothetical protein
MFTREAYIQNLPRYLGESLIPCEYWRFDARDGLGEGEGRIQVARAETEAFDSSLHFFINVLRFQQAMDYHMGNYGAAPDDETFAEYGVDHSTPRLRPVNICSLVCRCCTSSVA